MPNVNVIHLDSRRKPVCGTGPHEETSVPDVVGLLLPLGNLDDVNHGAVELFSINSHLRHGFASTPHHVDHRLWDVP